MYNTEKKNNAIALKRVIGLTCKELNAFMKSSNTIYVTYSGRDKFQMSNDLKEKISALVEKRKNTNVDIAGILFRNTLEVIFVYYVNGNPEDAYYEKNTFYNQSEFEMELDNQLKSDFIPPKGSTLHVFYPMGCSLPMDLPMDVPVIYM